MFIEFFIEKNKIISPSSLVVFGKKSLFISSPLMYFSVHGEFSLVDCSADFPRPWFRWIDR